MRLVVTAADYDAAVQSYSDEPTATPWATLNAWIGGAAGLQLMLFEPVDGGPG